MKKVYLLLLAVLCFTATQSLGQATNGIYESYAILSINGGANAFYDLQATTTNPDFQGTNLGNFNSTQSLVVRGGQNKTFKCNGGDIFNGRMNWRVWRTSLGASGTYTVENMGFISNDPGGCGGNQTWEGTGGAANIISSLTIPGNYTLEVYTDADGVPGTVTANNGGANYRATFTFCGPAAGALPAGNYAIPGCFATVAAAVSYINTNGISGTGGVQFDVAAGHTETVPAGGISITATGTAANPIIFKKSGAGANPTFTAPSPAGTAGVLHDAIFEIVGGDYITLDGFTMLENAANTTTTAASNNMVEWGVALLYASTTNGAQNNTIQNCTITLNRTYQNTWGIYSNSTHSATTVTTSATATTTAGGNSGLKIYGNTISNVNQGIVVVGPTAAADHNTGIDIGGTGGAQANTITNWGTTGTFSGYVNISGTLNCILMRNSTGFNISFNTLTSSVGGNTATTSERAIYVPSFSVAPTGTFTNNINNNTISVQSGFITGTVNGIINETTTGTATSSLNINNNNFAIMNHTVAASGAHTYINSTMAHLNTTINNNTFTNLTVSSTGNVTFISNNVTVPAGGSQTINGNSIVTAFNKTGAGGTVTGITSASSSTTVTQNWNNNNFSNITVSGATTLTFITNTDGGSVNHNITGNTFSNITGGTSAISGIISSFGGANGGNGNLVSNNTISNITSAGAITGIQIGSSGTTSTVTGNVISGLTTTGASVVNGITSASPTSCAIFKNRICNLESNNASGSVNGILVSAGTLHNIYNNRIGDLRTPTANAANPLVGINITGGTTVNVYFNTVNLNGASTGALFGSSAISASTTPTLALNNNILVNNSTTTGAGLAAAYRRSTTTLTTYAATSDRNDFFATTIFTDGTNTDATLAAYKTRVTPSDANSISVTAPFLSTACGNAGFLKIDPAVATQIESGGANVGGITDDFEGDIRQGNGGYAGTGTAPDIGADEVEGTPAAVCTGTPPSSTVGGSAAVCTGFGTTLTLSNPYTELGYTFQWASSTTAGGPYTNMGTSATQATGALTVTTYYVCTVTCTNSGLTYTTAEKTVTVNPLPSVGVSPASGTLCQPGASAIALTATGANTYSWSPAAGLSATTGASVNANPSVTTTYTVTGTDANGCVNTANTIITVANKPLVGLPTATPATICAGDNSQLLAEAYNPSTVNNYLFSTSTGATLDPMTGATSIVSSNTDDAPMNTSNGANTTAGASIPIGFNFSFNGTSYTHFSASPDGWVSLGTTTAAATSDFSNGVLDATNIPKLYPYWDDMATGTTGSVQSLVTGTAPNRILKIQWFVTIPRATGGAANSTFQAWLYEATGKVEFRYGTMGTGSMSASVGLTGSTPATQFQSITLSTNTSSNTVPDNANAGQPASGTMFTFVPPSTGITYLWSPTTFIPGGQETTVNPLATALTTTTAYTVDVTANGCTVTSPSVTVTVSAGAAITGQPVALTRCAGENANFTVTATGAGLTYQWKKDGVDLSNGGAISGATSAGLTITGVVAADAGVYTVVVSSTCGSPVTSDGTATLTVNPLPATVVASGAGTFCTSTIITAANGGDGTIYFQGTTSNGTSTTTPSTSETITASGTYYFRAQSAAGCWGPQGSVVVIIHQPAGITGTDAAVCQGGSGTLAAVAASGCVVFANAGTSLAGTFTAGDAQALRPATSIINTTTCSFDATILRGYQSQQFQVSVTGAYVFDMTSSDDGMAYITEGAFVPGSCGSGTWVRGDDDSGPGNDPQLSMTLTAGTTYTLYSTTWSGVTGNSTAAYSWTITPPAGGQLMLPNAGNIEWYTSASGGTAIGTGSPFNPVGVSGSGLANTNTPGTTVFYAACSNSSTCRTPVNFVISQAATVSAGPAQTICAGATATMAGTFGGAATSITWTSSGTGTFNDATLVNAVYTPSAADTAAGSVVLTITTDDPAGVCGSVNANMTLTINSVPALTIVNPPTACGTIDITSATVQTVNTGVTTKYYTTLALANAGGPGDVATPAAIAVPNTYFIRSESAAGCFVVKPVLVTIYTAANNAILAPAGTTTMTATDICEDGVWTYYKNPADPAQILFGVRWGTDPANLTAKAAASISLTKDATHFSAEDPTFGTGKATYTMSRYWNIDLAGNTLGVPVDIRFFYAPAEKTAVQAASGNFASTYGVASEPFSWFKTASGPFIPSVTSVIPDFVVTSTPLTDVNEVAAATLNGVLYAQFNGLSSFSGGTFATGNSPGGGGSVLPVKVEYFRGTKQASSHVLDWKVSCTNTQYAKMTVEMSTDGRNFNGIYSIKETAVRCQQPFSFTNINPVAGISYYRLKMEDDYGVVSYSSIVALMNGIKGFELVNIAPNPVTEGRFKLNITSAEQKKMEVYVTDVTGKIVQKQTVNIIPGFNAVEMNVSKLASGTYQLFGITTEGKTRVLQFVKQ